MKQDLTGVKPKPEAAVIPRPSLPSPSFRVRSAKGRSLVFLGLRAIEAAGISGYPLSGVRMEARRGEPPGPPSRAPSARANRSSTRSRIISFALSARRGSPPWGPRPDCTRSADKLEGEVSYFFLMPSPEAKWVRGAGWGAPVPSECHQCAQRSQGHVRTPGSVSSPQWDSRASTWESLAPPGFWRPAVTRQNFPANHQCAWPWAEGRTLLT